MKNIFDRYLSVQTDDDLVAQRGKLLTSLILVLSVGDLILIFTVIVFPSLPGYLLLDVLSLIVFGVLYWFTRRGYRWPSYVFLAFLALIIPYMVQENLQKPWMLAVAIPVVMAPLIAPSWLCVLVVGIEAISLYGFAFVSKLPSLDPIVVITLGIIAAVSWLASWNLERALNEARRSARDLAESNRELQASRGLLETSMRDVERRSAQLEASAEVGRAATTVLEAERLMRQVVELIRERFGLYYVGLFLVEEGGEWAVLRAGTGEAGQAMLARGHRIRVGEGMVGWSVAHAQARVALDVGEDAVRLATAELPGTRSEAALPLRSRGRVVGALTVQSEQPGAFDQETVVVLQTMADQVAVAVDNARLFAETQTALEATRRAYGELSREAWVELLRTQPDLGYRSGERGTASAGDVWHPEMQEALQKGEVVQCDEADAEGKLPLAVPIKVRGNVIGILDTYKPGGSGAWTPGEIELMETLADQVGMALESARLYRDAQRRAARERLTREITDRMRRAVDMDDLMQIAVREMAAALGTSRTFVQLSTPPEVAGDGDKDNGHQTND